MTDHERWVSRQAVADHLGVGLEKVDQLVASGMPHVNLTEEGDRSHRRFRLSEVDEWLEKKAAAA